MSKERIHIEAQIHASLHTVWECWTEAKHIVHWNQASDDWHTPHATNDVRPGGSFLWRMEAKDGSFGFDFGGSYDSVQQHAELHMTIGDGRKWRVTFEEHNNTTRVSEEFEIEDVNSAELQRAGWQAILNSFKNYVESLNAAQA